MVNNRTAGALLWVIQGLLAAIFLFSGGFKLVTPAATLTKQAHMSGTFLHFIAVLEVFGAIGLILPWLLRIKPVLTPIAAAGLVILMIGATVVTLKNGGGATAVVPAAVGVLCAIVVVFRSREVRAQTGPA